MEIIFELEDSDLEYSFEPDFRVQQQNTADHSAVSWGLPSSRDALNVVVLCDEFYDESPPDTTFLVAQMCDCYLDEMRASHPYKHINNLDDNETRTMGLRLIKVCNINPEPKKT